MDYEVSGALGLPPTTQITFFMDESRRITHGGVGMRGKSEGFPTTWTNELRPS